MATKLQREVFTGKYDGVTPPTILEPGGLTGGLNMRKVSTLGGWKARKGSILHNTTALESGSAIKSLHTYKNSKQGDYHFLTQVNSKLYVSTENPPTVSGATFGTDLGVTVGATPGFSCIVGERFFYADGSGRPIVWGGDNPYPLGFLVYDASTDSFIDYTREVTDGRPDTSAVMLPEANDRAYIITSEPCEGFVVDLGTGVNTNASALTVKSWRGGDFVTVSNLVDGTLSAGATFALDGTVTWTRSTSDAMRLVRGLIMGYVYELTWSVALSTSVNIVSLKVKQDACNMTNKWDGAFEWVSGVKFYDESLGQYIDYLGKLTSDSLSMYLDLSEATISDYLYFKTLDPCTALYIGVVDEYGNTADAQIDLIEYWNGSSFTTVGAFIDEAKDGAGDSSFAQCGMLWLNAAAIAPRRKVFQGDNVPGYWYRISWDAALSTDCRIYMLACAFLPISLPVYKGCLGFKNRLFLWGDPEFPNRLRFSARNMPDCFCGTDSGYTDAVGDASEILCAVEFYNELLVFKKTSIYLLEGDNPFTFGYLQLSSTVGLASPQTARVVEVGFPSMHKDEPMSIATFQDVDGVYVVDGRKPRKVSVPYVDHYFNNESSSCIAAASIENRAAFIDPLNNEYHLLLPSSELVYNFVTDEWYPPWEREIDLTCGIVLRGTDGRYYTYGGTAGGHVMRLEYDTTDKSTSNADVAIPHSIKTRAISAEPDKGPSMRFTLRRLWAELKAQTAGTITTKLFRNQATSGTTLSLPSAMSMVNSGYNVAMPKLEVSQGDCDCFQIELSLNVADQEMEIRELVYESDIRGVT